jgi:putative transposase
LHRLKRELDRVWIDDITYLPTQEGWLYLAALLNMFNRKVVGWATFSPDNPAVGPECAPDGSWSSGPGNGFIAPFRPGNQNESAEYQRIFKDRNITCSMGRKDNCYDNALVESFFVRLKSGWVNHHRHPSKSEAIHSLFYYTEIFFNRKMRHSSIGFVSSQKYETFLLAT